MTEIISLCNIYNDSHLRDVTTFYDSIFYDWSQYYRQVHTYLSLVICFAGILGNVGIVIVLSERSMRSSVNTLLIAIACFDMSLMVAYVCYQMVVKYPSANSSYAGQVYTAVFANWSMVAHSVSLWLTVVMAFMRFMILLRRTVHQGVWNNISVTVGCILCTTVAVIVVSLLNMARNNVLAYRSPLLYFNATHQHRDLNAISPPPIIYYISPPKWWDCSMEKINFWITGVSLKIIPCILLTIVMALLIKEVVSAGRRRARLLHGHGGTPQRQPQRNRLRKILSFTESANSGQEKTDRITTVLLAIVVIFWITEMPQGVLYVLTAIEPANFYVYQHMGDVLDLLSLLNSCVNFVLYCLMSTVFRNKFKSTFLGRCSAQSPENMSRNSRSVALFNDNETHPL